MTLLAGVWVNIWQVCVMEGVESVCCSRDRLRFLSLVLANLERMSALTLRFSRCVRRGLVQRQIE